MDYSSDDKTTIRELNEIIQEFINADADRIDFYAYERKATITSGGNDRNIKSSIPEKLYSALISRIKLMACMDITNKSPKKGRIELRPHGATYIFDIRTTTSKIGEHLSMIRNRDLETTLRNKNH